MSAVAAKLPSEYPWFIRLFFWKQKRTYGRILDPSLLWGRSPWVFATVALLYGALDRRSSPIAPALTQPRPAPSLLRVLSSVSACLKVTGE